MAITADQLNELKQSLIGIETKRAIKAITWPVVQADIASFTADDQNLFLAAIKDGQDVSQFVGNRLTNYATAQATTTVQGYLDAGSFPVDFIANIIL